MKSKTNRTMSKTRTPRAQSPTTASSTFAQIAAAVIDKEGLAEDRQRTLRALLGVDGFCKRPMGCDEMVRLALTPHTTAAIRREIEGVFSGRALVRIEINDDCGLSPITAPRLRIKAIADRTIKTLNALKVEGICTIRVQPYREDAAIDATMMVVRSWTLGFAPPGMTHAELQTRLRQQLTVSVTKVPNVRVKPVAADGLDMEVGSFLKLPTRTVTLQRSAKGARRWSPAATMSDVEAWSAIEATAEISLPYLLIGVGPRGRAWAGDLKSKVLAAQRARVEQGLGGVDIFRMINRRV